MSPFSGYITAISVWHLNKGYLSIPKSNTDLQRFMGMINYIGKFIHHLHVSQISDYNSTSWDAKNVHFDLQQHNYY